MALVGQGFQISPISLVAGNSGSSFAMGGGMTQFFTDAGNVTTGETDLYSYTVPAGLFGSNGAMLESVIGGIYFGSTSSKRIRLYFGGTQIFDTGALNVTVSGHWQAQALIVRVSASVVRATVLVHADSNTNFSSVTYTEVTGLTLANSQIFKITGTAAGGAAATNDIVAKLGNVFFIANNG